MNRDRSGSRQMSASAPLLPCYPGTSCGHVPRLLPVRPPLPAGRDATDRLPFPPIPRVAEPDLSPAFASSLANHAMSASRQGVEPGSAFENTRCIPAALLPAHGHSSCLLEVVIQSWDLQ